MSYEVLMQRLVFRTRSSFRGALTRLPRSSEWTEERAREILENLFRKGVAIPKDFQKRLL